MTVGFEAVEAESRSYPHYDDTTGSGYHGSVSTLIHPANGTFICSSSVPFVVAVLRLILDGEGS